MKVYVLQRGDEVIKIFSESSKDGAFDQFLKQIERSDKYDYFKENPDQLENLYDEFEPEGFAGIDVVYDKYNNKESKIYIQLFEEEVSEWEKK